MTVITANNPFTQMQKTQYENETDAMMASGGPGGHRHHDANPDYWGVLLKDLTEGDWSTKLILDFGCGGGRNVWNVLHNVSVKEAHGCDISSSNIRYCENYLKSSIHTNFKFFTVDGVSVSNLPSDTYDFIFSTITLQHISVYSIRNSILKDLYRVLKTGGILSFQMGFGPGHPNPTPYYDDRWNLELTNGAYDVQILDEQVLSNHLLDIGFNTVTTQIRPSWADINHQTWIYARATK